MTASIAYGVLVLAGFLIVIPILARIDGRE